MEESTIWDRGILDWLILVFAVSNAMTVTIDIYRGGINLITIFNAFVSGLCFTGWLYSGMFNRSQRLAKKCLRQTSEVLEKYREASKLVEKIVNEKIELENKIINYERETKNRCSQRNKRRKR